MYPGIVLLLMLLREVNSFFINKSKMDSLSEILENSRTGKFFIYFFNKLLNELLSFVIPKRKMGKDLNLNGDEVRINCHSERSEESRKMLLLPLFSGFFTSFRMTEKRILYYSFLLLLLITSCAQVPIKLKQLNSEINIEEGQEATVVWKFENALQVKIDGDNKLYYPYDSIKIKPKAPTTIKIIAYQSEKDSLAVYSNINIKKEYGDQRTTGIQRGPSLLEQYKDTLSKTEAYFKQGEIKYNTDNPPEYLKTVGSIYPYYSPNTCLIKTLILDKFGNFITNLENQNNLKIAVTSSCSEYEFLNNVGKIEFINDTSSDYFTDNLILLDVSSKSHNHFQVFEEIKQFAKRLSINDNLGFSLFNHSYRQIVPINSPEAANFAIQNTALQEKSGLNAMLSSISSAIYQLKETGKNKKNLIIISSSTDDCSFNSNINELVQLAKENHVSIYSIGLGNEVDGYGLSFLASATGGKYYVLEDNELSLVKNALSEILFSQRTYYQFEVPVSFYIDKCSEVKTNIEYNFDSLKISDKSSIFLKEDLKYYPRFIAALFNENDFSIDEEYRQNVINIADYLILNNHIKIEIIGHSSENESSFQEVGNMRAVKLMEQLISLGVNSKQIKIKCEGATKPIYLEPIDSFQEKYNRRVEIKILDPSQLPYQIAAEKANTESDAALLVNIWKKLGYKSYFERVIIEKNPEYHVKIWGYPTIEQAQEEALKINKLYNKDFVVE